MTTLLDWTNISVSPPLSASSSFSDGSPFDEFGLPLPLDLDLSDPGSFDFDTNLYDCVDSWPTSPGSEGSLGDIKLEIDGDGDEFFGAGKEGVCMMAGGRLSPGGNPLNTVEMNAEMKLSSSSSAANTMMNETRFPAVTVPMMGYHYATTPRMPPPVHPHPIHYHIHHPMNPPPPPLSAPTSMSTTTTTSEPESPSSSSTSTSPPPPPPTSATSPSQTQTQQQPVHTHMGRQPHYHAVSPYHIWAPNGTPLRTPFIMRPIPHIVPPHLITPHPHAPFFPHPHFHHHPTPPKTFICTTCSKSFKRAEHLNRHTRMHTGERPFLCDEEGCERRFSRSDNLAAHKRTHEKDRTQPSRVRAKK